LQTEHHADVAIVGAGPAGSACVMALKESGLRIAWIDKSTFPRDKVCGDAIPSNVQRVLKQIDPLLNERFLNQFTEKLTIEGCRFVSPDLSSFDLTFTTKGHASKRIDFDHFLFDMANEVNSSVTHFLKAEIKTLAVSSSGAKIELHDGNIIHAKMIVGCDGTNSFVRKKLAKPFVQKHENIAAVRAYYSNVADLSHNLLEIHIVKNYMPGYFWIFPMKNNAANVGFGMVNKYIAQSSTDLKIALKEIVSSERFSQRFKDATTDGVISGYGLACGGRKNPISGERFLLCGDAASLINPATGEGIGNAMISGRIAAQHLISCFEKQQFNASFNHSYDKMVYKKLLKDLRIQRFLQKLTADREWLINFALKKVSRHEFVREQVRKFF
jgi:geranylgeranyl reductase family protein